MNKLLAVLLCTFIGACRATSASPDATGDAENPTTTSSQTGDKVLKFHYVGTYESFATPLGSSVSVLMSDGEKIKIASVDDTAYININTHRNIPEMRINGTYGVNGYHKKSSYGGNSLFIVKEIEYLSGGLEASSKSARSALPDFFDVDPSAKGPLTRSELAIRFPASLKRYFDKDDLECFYRQVDSRVAELGDPVTMPPIRRVLLTNNDMRWNEMTVTDKRRQLARYVTGMALSEC